MNNQATGFGLVVLALAVLCEPVQASTWQMCRMDVRVTEVLKHPYPQLQAQILKATPASTSVECPEVGTTITFTPETTDYQATLPRRQWPKKGSRCALITVIWMASVKAMAMIMRVG